MKKSLIVATLVIILAGGAWALTRDSKPVNNRNVSNTSESSSTVKVKSTGSDLEVAATITYSDSGFSPDKLTVPAGSKITVRNDSSGPLQFDSDPHPQHTEDPELNIGAISPGDSQTITVTKTGTHGYHNHLNSGDTGTLIVQ